MKKYLLFWILLPLSLSGISQEWAPIGATWYYTEYVWGSSGTTYRKIIAEKDTIYQGRLCTKLNFYNRETLSETHYTYESDDTVYFYNDYLQQFKMLFTFNAQPGDVWEINFPINEYYQDTIVMNVDSIGSMTIDGVTLRIVYAKQTDPDIYHLDRMGYYGPFIQSIGTPTMLPRPDFWDPLGSIRCYEDHLFNYQNDTLPCDYSNLGLNTNNATEFVIYPNPMIDYLKIKSNLSTEFSYEIFDLKMNSLLKGTATTEEDIDASGLRRGIYIIELKINKKEKTYLKFLKS